MKTNTCATAPSARLATFFAVLTLGSGLVRAQAPANDNFANATVITGSTVSLAGTNIGASFEAGEPVHSPFVEAGHNDGGYSVWWQWTAPQTGACSLAVVPPPTGPWFDAMLAIYTGSTLNSLTRLWAGIGGPVSFFVTEGETYRFAVDGGFGTTSPFTLNLAPATGMAPMFIHPLMGQGGLPGQDLFLGAMVTGTERITYQWRKGATNLVDGGRISGATTSTLRITGAQAGDAGDYSLVATNLLGSVPSGNATVTVSDPVFSFQPQPYTANVGDNVYLNGYALGAAPLTYRWRKGTTDLSDGGNIAGSSTSNLTLSNVQTADAGDYFLVVTNGASATVTSTPAALTVNAPGGVPVINSATTAVATVGTPFSFSITATNSPTSFGATGLPPGITLNSSNGGLSGTPTTAGTFPASVTAINGIGGGPSSTLTITVGSGATAPANDNFAHAQAITGNTGTIAGTNVGATGETGEPIHHTSAGTTSSVWYKWTAAQNGGMAFDTNGSDFDTVMAVYTGSSLTGLTKLGENDDGGSGGGASRVLISVSASTVYYVAIGSWGSSRGNLTLNWATDSTPMAPTLVTQPVGQSVAVGGNATFSVVASGTAPLAYQWRREGVDLSGETLATLSLANVQSSQAGAYTVMVSNSVSSVTSQPALLTVSAPGVTTEPFDAVVAGRWSTDVGTDSGAFSVAYGALNFTSGVLRNPSAGGPPASAASREWIQTPFTRTADWAVQVDVNFNATLVAGQSMTWQLRAASSADPTDFFAIDYFRHYMQLTTSQPPVAFGRTFNNGAEAASGQLGGLSQAFGTLRLTYVASTQTLTAWLDGDGSANGYTFSSVFSTTLASAGWNMGAGDTFVIRLTATNGTVANDTMPVVEGACFADNFQTLVTPTGSIGAPQISALSRTSAATLNAGSSVSYNYAITLASGDSLTWADLLFADAGGVEKQITVTSASGVGAIDTTTSWLNGNYTFLKAIVVTAAAGRTDFLRDGTVAYWNSAVTGPSTHSVAFANLDFSLTGGQSSGGGPANNQFADRIALTGLPVSTTGSNVGANKESGEPSHVGSGGASVWWTWTAPLSGSVTVDTNGSTFDTMLAVYTGNSLDGLSLVGSDDDGGTGVASQLTFAATSGTVYQIAVDGFSGLTGSIALHLAAGGGATLPVISSLNMATTTAGLPFAYTITATNAPTSFAAAGLPAGLSVNTTSGEITGTPTTPGSTEVTLTATNGSGTSVPFTLTLVVIAPTAPTITTHPLALAVPAGGDASFTVVATGTPPLTYQWRKEGVDLTGATAATFTLNGVQVANAGSYAVTVSNHQGNTPSRPALLYVGAPTGVRSVAAGSDFTLFVTNDGTLWGTGNNNSGQLGGAATPSQPTPIPLAAGVQAVEAGLNHTLFLKTDGTLWTMGHNPDGAIGDGTTSGRNVPFQVASGVTAMAGGYFHSLFIKTDGTLWGMGDNSAGQLGDGTTTNRLIPIQVPAVGNVVAVSAGNWHSLFVLANGTLWAMGANDTGQLCDGTTTNRVSPVQVATGVSSVSAAWFYTLYVKTDGTLMAAGNNEYGKLGDGSTANRASPVQIATGVVRAYALSRFSAFLKTDGTLWTMGNNDHSQLGDGTLVNRPTPASFTGGVSLAAIGDRHTVWVKTDGSLWGVGGNGYAQLGQPSSAPKTSPVLLAAASGPGVAPTITTHPVSQTVAAGTTITFSVVATGTAPLAYQWKKDGAELSAATNASLVLTSVQTGDAASYSVVVSNSFGQLSSAPAMLTLGTSSGAPVITTHPASQTVAVGGNVTFSIVATGTAPLSYQWQKATTPIASATNASLTLSNVQAVDAADYRVYVSNTAGNTTSQPATLTVLTPPEIMTQPQGQTVAVGGTINLLVVVNSLGTPTYRWRKGVADIPNGTFPFLLISSAQTSDAGDYSVVVTNGGGSVTSAVATVMVSGTLTPPTITTQPVAQTVSVGGTATFSVVATGSPTLHYQGKKGGADIANATGATLTLSNVQTTDAGTYTIVVSNNANSVTSDGAVLTVNAATGAPTITTQPLAQTVGEGTTITLTVVASGSPTLAYEWRKGGAALADSGRISGGTSATLTITGALPVDSGIYSVVVTNSVNAATSTSVIVGVVPTGTSVVHAAPGGYFAGTAVTVTNTITYVGAAAGLTWNVLLPDGWSYASSGGAVGSGQPTPGAVGVLDWTWTSVPPSPVTFTYTLNVPLNATGTKELVAMAGLQQNGVTLQRVVQPDRMPLAPSTAHRADTDRNFRISLLELTRVIELYNTRLGSIRTGRYKVQAGTEDGFAPDPDSVTSQTLSVYHAADANPRDGQISLFELTRVIELYNFRSGTTRTGEYHVQAQTEDGFNPGP